jgi:protein-disulfide isomerase
VSRARQVRRKERQKERELTEEAAERARTSRRKSVIRIVRVALAAIAVAVAGVLVAAGVSGVAGSSGQPSSARVEKEVSALLSGIPQGGDTLGRASAPITLQIFGDLESADVRTFVVWLLPDIIRKWVRTGIVAIQYRSFMSASSPYPNVFLAQQAAALAAGVQDRLWNFIETFYHEQGQEHTRYVTRAYLEGIAKQVPGLDVAQWKRDREIRELSKQVAEDDHAAQAIGFPDAPVFLIGRTGGRLTPWLGYRLYEEPGLTPGLIKRPVHPLAFITSKALKVVIEHLREPVDQHSTPR